MLTQPLRIGETTRCPPACAWFRGALWLAYCGVDGELVLRAVRVLGDTGSNLFSTGLECSDLTSLAADERHLYVAFGTNGGRMDLTATTLGSSFAEPQFLLKSGLTGRCGLTWIGGRLAFLWAEIEGGRAHLALSDDEGANWDDGPLPFALTSEPAHTTTPDGAHLAVAYSEPGGGAGSFTVAIVNPLTRSVTAQTTMPTPALARRVAICATGYHDRPALHVAAEEEIEASRGWSGRSLPANLTSVGGVEPFTARAIGLSLAFDGRRTWAAWMEEDTGELWVAPYSSVFGLPLELQDRIGEKCDPKTCPVDPRLVCAASDEIEWILVSPSIHNARRGDVIMTPGDGSGLIGTLLAQLEPRQFYDHMGIMVSDNDLVRHATMAHKRMNRPIPGHYMTGEFFGERAPVDGFRADVLTYGWPGTITQSIDDAFFRGFNTVEKKTGRPYNKQGDFLALNPGVAALPRPAEGASQDTWDAWNNQQGFADPEYPQDETFAIHNFPDAPAYLPDTGVVIDPVVVKPAPELEAADPRVRATLHRVAAAAERIDGHYRFYSYTNGRIAFDPALFGPRVGDSLWAGKPPGAAWSAGTRPVVCSSFVWAAVQLANAEFPTIVVEGELTEDPEELLASPTVDGLYRYLVDERVKAGEALHSLLVDKVRGEVYDALQKEMSEHPLPFDLTAVTLTTLLTLIAGPAGAALALLGLTPENLAALKLLLEDMPDDVATQLCNAFAVDRADETDDDLWQNPGEGLAVSPDDIKKFWDAPGPAAGERSWHGLYGHTERLLLTPWRMEPRHVHRLARSRGPAFVEGRVLYHGQPVLGATVRFGCETTMTWSRVPSYEFELSAGRYEGEATAYWPASQQKLTGRVRVDLQPGDQPGPIDIELEDPPKWRRLIRCTGKIDTVRTVVIGTDDWSHTGISQQSWLTWAPSTWGEPPGGASVKTWKPSVNGKHAQRFNVRVDLTVTLQEDLSLEVVARATLCENYYKDSPPTGDQIVTTKESDPVTIERDGSRTFTFDLASAGVPPDRGHVELKVENLQAPA